MGVELEEGVGGEDGAGMDDGVGMDDGAYVDDGAGISSKSNSFSPSPEVTAATAGTDSGSAFSGSEDSALANEHTFSIHTKRISASPCRDSCRAYAESPALLTWRVTTTQSHSEPYTREKVFKFD